MSLISYSGKVKPHTVVSDNPAANAEATITVPAGQAWLIVSARLTVAQAATQTPLPSLVITDANGVVVGSYAGASAAMSASTTSTFDWYAGAPTTAGAGATFNRSNIPDGLVVKGGWTVSTSTAGKGANTDLSALALHVLKL
jgi:hypothetical protein